MKRIISIVLAVVLMTGCTASPVSKELYDESEQGSTSIVEAVTEAATLEVTDQELSEKGSYGKNGVWYEIFVRAFADGDGDGIGDLKGLTQAIDYLNDGKDGGDDLGINGVWLMPINPSPSYHGYDVTDYYDINPEYGTMADFEAFLEAADQRDIDVIIDLVVNHSSAQHPWFQSAVADPESPYRDFYSFLEGSEEGYDLDKEVWGHKVWNATDTGYYYGIFWDQMPDLNFDHEPLREEVKNIAKFWLEKGVDGFRMDAALHIYGYGEKAKGFQQTPANIEWWLEFDAACRQVNPDYYLVGEVWDNVQKRGKYSEAFDTTFNFDMSQDNILRMVQSGIDLDRNNGFIEKMTFSYEEVSKRNEAFIEGSFLTNHDQNRAMGYFEDWEQMALAANIYMTIPGNPFIYYGEEIGMVGNGDHEVVREPFIWGDTTWQTSWEPVVANVDTVGVDDQIGQMDSLLNHYREIIGTRQKNPALLSGDFTGYPTASNKIVAYGREVEGQSVIVIHNLRDEVQIQPLSELNVIEGKLIYVSRDMQVAFEEELKMPPLTTVIIELE